jgi:hypothetical protein
LKVAICIPAYGDTKAKFTQSLAGMIAYFLSTKLIGPDGEEIEKEVETIIVSSSMLPESRHRLVAEALAIDADYLLCMDADHTFPRQALNRLLTHNLAIVGCNYSRRHIPTGPTASRGDKLVYTTIEKAQAEEIEEVDHIGLGLCLINARVFDVLQAKAEEDGARSFLPLFKFEEMEDRVGLRGEDVYFFDKCRAAGLKIHCDHGLSWHVGHCMEMLLTNETAAEQREHWEAFEKSKADKFADKAARLEGQDGE